MKKICAAVLILSLAWPTHSFPGWKSIVGGMVVIWTAGFAILKCAEAYEMIAPHLPSVPDIKPYIALLKSYLGLVDEEKPCPPHPLETPTNQSREGHSPPAQEEVKPYSPPDDEEFAFFAPTPSDFEAPPGEKPMGYSPPPPGWQ